MAATNEYSKTTPQAISGLFQTWDKTGPTLGPPTSVVPVNFTWMDNITGVKLPNWKKLIQEHRDATTNMTANLQDCRHLDGVQYIRAKNKTSQQIRHSRKEGWIDRTSGFNANPFNLIPSDSALRDANSKWYARAYAAQTQLMSGVVLGELRETLSMVKGRGASLVNLLAVWRTAAMRLRKTDKNILRHLADLYLELMFGWRPAVSDINGALDAWKKPRLEVTRVSASAKSDVDKGITRSTTSTGVIQYDTERRSSTNCTVRVRGGVKVQVNGHGRNLQAFGLNAQSFVPTIYELIPWSFFVDYFTDLGNVINAISFPASDVAWGSTSTTRSYKTLVLVGGARLFGNVNDWDIQETIDSPQVTEYTNKEVTRIRGVPRLPTPTVRLPTSLLKWANIAALTISGFSRTTRLRV